MSSRFLYPILLPSLLFTTSVIFCWGESLESLSKQVLEISLTAAELSKASYILDEFESNTYEAFFGYVEEPDVAIVAKKDGRCYVAFRGTKPNFDDWQQNLNPLSRNVYKDNDVDSDEFCETRKGYADFIDRSIASDGLGTLTECLQSINDDCEDGDEDETSCLVITGHSQGGAMATVASIILHQYNPMLITFGQPPAVDSGCPLIPTTKYYRYVNSITDPESNLLSFDGVVFAPNWISDSVHYGYFLLLGDDSAALKYLGHDQDYTFEVESVLDYSVTTAHNMYGNDNSYYTRVETLLTNYPISINGFDGGVVCEETYKELCESGICNVVEEDEESATTGVCTDPPTQSPSSAPSADDTSSSSTTNHTVTSAARLVMLLSLVCFYCWL